MSRRELYLDVAEARSLVVYAWDSLPTVPEEWESAFRALETALISAAGGLPAGPRNVVDKVAIFAATWGGATVAHSLHFGTGWTVTAAVTALLAGSGLAMVLSNWGGPRIVRRRLAAVPLERQPIGRSGRTALVRARTIVIAAARREAGPAGLPTLESFRWAGVRRRTVGHLSTADRYLCQVIELYFREPDKVN